ncbi:hypothetical protein LTR53_006138 [Teratosphaeriaceae sp. CCFEE 6253]|nr:hypothetical protein LTR53_006138 [Teratosphaeriaceae sp. CCFEE 6253]
MPISAPPSPGHSTPATHDAMDLETPPRPAPPSLASGSSGGTPEDMESLVSDDTSGVCGAETESVATSDAELLGARGPGTLDGSTIGTLQPAAAADRPRAGLHHHDLVLHELRAAAQEEDGGFDDAHPMLGWLASLDDPWSLRKARYGESAAQHAARLGEL